MAKNLNFNRLFFLFIYTFIFYVPAISQDGSAFVIDGSADAIREQYRKMIGIKEATGNNDGKEVEKILATVGLGKGFPWCAAAVKYGLLNAGIVSAKQINGMALSCENKKSFVYKSRTWLRQLIHGDVFTIYYARLKRIGHTGFVDRIANKEYGTVVTYEGNTNSGGSRDGDGFYVRIRQIASLHSISRWR